MIESKLKVTTTLKQLMIFILVFAMILPLTTAFAYEQEIVELLEYVALHEHEELPEIEPYYFNPAMISQVDELLARSLDMQIPEAPALDLSQLNIVTNELTELSPDALRALQQEQGVYRGRDAHLSSIGFCGYRVCEIQSTLG
ncbi:MAG: hypothetical protein FWC75_00135 [Oscillospiraceae bacterium]|nr:hypothetical protein [Oscillospiraceae bacterium]